MMQFFEWHVAADGKHWDRLKETAPALKAVGIDSVWVPPVTKAVSADDTGYGVYDLYDLGEYDQKVRYAPNMAQTSTDQRNFGMSKEWHRRLR